MVILKWRILNTSLLCLHCCSSYQQDFLPAELRMPTQAGRLQPASNHTDAGAGQRWGSRHGRLGGQDSARCGARRSSSIFDRLRIQTLPRCCKEERGPLAEWLSWTPYHTIMVYPVMNFVRRDPGQFSYLDCAPVRSALNEDQEHNIYLDCLVACVRWMLTRE